MNRFKTRKAPHGFSPQTMWLMLCMLFVGTGSAWADEYVAQIGSQKYTDLTEAFYDASAGQTVELLQDLDISVTTGTDPYCAEIPNSITFDGGGHKLTVNRRGISVAPQSNNSRAMRAPAAASTYDFHVTVKNITIENTASQSRGYGGRCITTRGKLGSLTLDNVTLTTDGSTYNGTFSPLFIGGSQATAATVNIINGSRIVADADAAKGDAITMVNPIALNITASTLAAATAIKFAEADESTGATGTTVAIANSTFTSSVAALYFYDNNITASIENSTVNAGAGSVATFGSTAGNSVTLTGTTVTYATLTDATNRDAFSVTTGQFNHVVPSAYLADGFDVTANLQGQEELTDALVLTNGSKMTIASGSIKGEVVADGGELVFGESCGTNDINVTGSQSLNLATGKFANDIDEQYLADHYATNLISGAYIVKPTIQIATVADLQALATLVNTPNGAATKGNTYELTADLDMTGVAWTPIGNVAAYPGRAFQGTFDGKGHTISNLKCIDNTVNYACAALFGSASGATIKNVTLTNVDIQSKHYAAGILAYHGDNTVVTVANCHVDGGSIFSTPELIGSSYDNGDKVGGIVGYATATDVITECSVKDVTITGYRDLGGIAGYTSGAVTESSVEDAEIVQSNINAYKSDDMTYTVGQIVGGRSSETAKTEETNTAANVTTTCADVARVGDKTYATLALAVAAATKGQTVEIYVADTYTMPSLPANITIKATASDVVFNCEGSGNIAGVPNGATFENVTMNFGTNDYHGFQHSGEITMKDCTLNGKFFNYYNMVFEGCTFNAPGTEASGYSNTDYCMWVYSGNVTYTDCTFNSAGKVVNVYNDQVYTTPFSVTATNCTFNSTVANKAAFNVKATSGSTALLYEVTVEDCTANGSWPAASTSESLVVLNALVQVDDINPAVASVTDVVEITEGVEEVLYTTRVAEYNGDRYDTLKEALDAAAAAGDKNIVVNLLHNADLPIGAWNGAQNSYSIGTEETEAITINGNDHILTFMTTNTDWNNVATMNDTKTKLVLNNMTIDQGGKNTKTTWNSYDIVFHSAVELNDVTSNRPVAFENSASVNDVTINADTNVDAYAIWISPRAENQTVSIDGLNLTGKRGIKVDDQYVAQYGDVQNVELDITEATFNTTKKAAILVKSAAETSITASNLNITNVAADNVNAVWVDENVANAYDLVTFTSDDAKMIPEGGAEAYTVVRKTGDKVNGYYTDLTKAVAEAEDGQTVTLYADFDLAAKSLTIENGITIDGQGHTVSSTAAQAVLIGAGSFNVTLNDLNVDATQIGLAAGTATDASSLYTGKLDINNSTFTVGTRGINLINVGEAFKLNLDGSTVQLRGIEDYNTGYSNADTRGINLCNFSAADGRIAANITNSTVQGFAYDINLPGNGSNVDVTMTGGKTAGRAALNIWGKNNALTLDGVEVHGLNNETGPTEAFACVVENENAENNTYTINGVTFIANLSEAAYTTATSSATENLVALRGAGSTFNITGNTTYTINEGAEDRGGLTHDEAQLQGNTVNLDAAAKENLANLIDALDVVVPSAEPDENGMYTLKFTGVVNLYSADMKTSKLFNTLAEAFACTEIFEAGSQMDLMADVALSEDITISLAAGQEFAIDLGSHSLTAGGGHILLPTGVIASVTATTDVFAKIEERDDLVPATSVLAPDYYTVSCVAEHHEVSYSADGAYYYFEEVFGEGMPAAGSVIALLKDVTMVQSVSSSNSFTLNFGGHSLDRGEYTVTLGSDVTVTTDTQVADYENFFIAANETEMVVETETSGSYTYAVVSKESEGIYELADGTNFPYALTSDVQAEKVTYTRSYNEDRVDKYQAWLLPFDYTITDEDLENFSFFKINMIANAAEAGETSATDDVWIFVNSIEAGSTLYANKPYLYKPKAAVDNYEFVSENVTLKAPTSSVLLQTATTEATYSFYGTYETTRLQPSSDHRDYYLSINGKLSYPASSTIAVGAYRWYLRMETKSGIDYARSIGFIEEDDTTVTGLERVVAGEEGDTYFTLNGVRVQTPGKGVYIKRSADGSTKKVSFK